MEFFKIRKDIPFMRHALVFNVISLLTFFAACAFLATKGLNLSIEFTGGVVIEARYDEAPDLEKIRGALLKSGVTEPHVQKFGSSRDVMIRLALKDAAAPSIASEGKLDSAKFAKAVLADAGPNAQIVRVEFVGPQVGRELAENGALAAHHLPGHRALPGVAL